MNMTDNITKQKLFTTTFDDWKYWSEQYSRETDRGLAITSSAMLDHLLASLIEKFLVDDKKATKELLCNSMSPLGTFASRIAIAYSLGLISSNERNDLNIIREIRNKFAHKAVNISFETEIIGKYIIKLKIPKLISITELKRQERTSRSIYIDTVSMISTFIEIRKNSLSDQRMPTKEFIIKKA
jgi:DNA-binding MltR family transcriptional regulator